MFKVSQYKHLRKGDVLKIEIRDQTYKLLYKKKINIQDKEALKQILEDLEKFSELKIKELFKEKIKNDQDWW